MNVRIIQIKNVTKYCNVLRRYISNNKIVFLKLHQIKSIRIGISLYNQQYTPLLLCLVMLHDDQRQTNNSYNDLILIITYQP